MQEAYQTRLLATETVWWPVADLLPAEIRHALPDSGTPFALRGVLAVGFQGQLSGATCCRHKPMRRLMSVGSCGVKLMLARILSWD